MLRADHLIRTAIRQHQAERARIDARITALQHVLNGQAVAPIAAVKTPRVRGKSGATPARAAKVLASQKAPMRLATLARTLDISPTALGGVLRRRPKQFTLAKQGTSYISPVLVSLRHVDKS